MVLCPSSPTGQAWQSRGESRGGDSGRPRCGRAAGAGMVGGAEGAGGGGRDWQTLAVGMAVGAAGAAALAAAWRAARTRRLGPGLPEGKRRGAWSGAEEGSAGVAPDQRLGAKGARDDEVLREHFTRNTQFWGEEGQARVEGAYVVVVGLGGVGSHAAAMLLRSGVGRLKLVDFDQVSLSSLNRHAVATRADVGLPKATCLARHFEAICPEAHVEAVVAMYDKSMEEAVLGGLRRPDFVLDAIDNIHTKVDLLAACKRRGLPVLCVAGAGAKVDPTRLRFGDISESTQDRLSKAVRYRLKNCCDPPITSGVPTLFSVEKPRMGLVKFDPAQGNPADFQLVPNFRVGIIPVLGTLPAQFGMAAATYILAELAQAPFEGEPLVKLKGQQYDLLLADLREREEARFGESCDVRVDADEVAYVVRELWQGCSARLEGDPEALAGGYKGLWAVTKHLCLTRWDENRPAAVDNLVLLTREEADDHDEAGVAQVRAEAPRFAGFVECQLRRARTEMAVV